MRFIILICLVFQAALVFGNKITEEMARQSCTMKCTLDLGSNPMCRSNPLVDQLHCCTNGQNFKNRCQFNCNRMCNNALALRRCASRVRMTTCDVAPINTATCPTPITEPTTRPTTRPPGSSAVPVFKNYQECDCTACKIDDAPDCCEYCPDFIKSILNKT